MIKKIKVVPNEPYYLLKITADSNDGDYITEETRFDKDYADEAIKAFDIIISKLMGAYALENYKTICNIEEGEILELVNLPFSEWGICHTIENCNLFYYDTEGFTYKMMY